MYIQFKSNRNGKLAGENGQAKCTLNDSHTMGTLYRNKMTANIIYIKFQINHFT